MFVKKLKADYDKLEYFNKGALGNVVLVGDSHADAIGYKLNEKLKEIVYLMHKLRKKMMIAKIYPKNNK